MQSNEVFSDKLKINRNSISSKIVLTKFLPGTAALGSDMSFKGEASFRTAKIYNI